jgi:oligopeptide transport system permease protein
VIAPYDPRFQDYSAIQQGPSWDHPFGTDALGRDQLSRVIYGARTSLAVGVFAQALALSIAVAVASLAAIGGRIGDTLAMRFTDVIYALPELLFIILLAGVMGSSLTSLFLAIGLVAWPDSARIIRAQMLSLREREFVAAAEALGASKKRIVFQHMLPNTLGPLIVVVTFGIPRAILAEATLSFLGIGVRPPTPSWGSMVQEGYAAVLATPELVLFPALAIALVMMAFTFLGDGLRDALDPRTR